MTVTIVELDGEVTEVKWERDTGLPDTSTMFNFYDAERDIGLVATDTVGGTEVPSSTVATANRVTLNLALEAMWRGGSFTFADGTVGPLLYPIVFSAKEFFFNGVIYTSTRMGGAMYGSGGRAYPSSEAAYYAGADGGAVTRLTRLDAPDGNSCVILLRGAGFILDGFDIKGARYPYDGFAGSDTRALACITVESRGSGVSSGKHSIRNCSLGFATYGIFCPAGYYTTPATALTANLNVVQAHADESYVDNAYISFIESYFRVENEQAVGWGHKNINCISPGIAYPMVVFDMYRAGKVTANNVILNLPTVTLLRTHETSENSNNYSITDFWYDNFEYLGAGSGSGAGQYLTLWRNTHTDPNASFYPVDINITGHIANDVGYYDTSKLIEFTSEDFGTTIPLPNWQDITIRVTNLPRVINGNIAFPYLGNGPYCYPSKAFWSPQQEVAGYSWVITNGVIQASEDDHTIDTEGAAATDDLYTINGGRANQILTLRALSSGRTPTIKAGVANLTNLSAFWKMDETVAFASRLDSHGPHHLSLGTENAATTGKIGSAAIFSDSISNCMYTASTTALQAGDIDFTLSCWVKILSKPAHGMFIVGKFASGPLYEYSIYWDNASDRFKFVVSSDGGLGAGSTIITATGAPAIGTWYHIVAGHDATLNEIFMTINGTAITAVAHAGGVYTGTGQFQLVDNTFGGSALNGYIDEVGYWKGKRLSTQEISDLYNAGTGQAYPFFPLTGNIRAAGDCALDNADDQIMLKYDQGAGVWRELCRSNNGS